MGHFIGTYQRLIRTSLENWEKIKENPGLGWGLLQRFCNVGHPYSEIRNAPANGLVGHEGDFVSDEEEEQFLTIERSWGGLTYLIEEALEENVFSVEEDYKWPAYPPAEVEEVSGWMCVYEKEDVELFLSATADLTIEKLRHHFNPVLMNRDDVYPMDWYDSNPEKQYEDKYNEQDVYEKENDFEVAIEDYAEICKFFKKAQQEEQVILHYQTDVY